MSRHVFAKFDDRIKQLFLENHGKLTASDLVEPFCAELRINVDSPAYRAAFKKAVNKVSKLTTDGDGAYFSLKDYYRQEWGLLSDADGLQVSILNALDGLAIHGEEDEDDDDRRTVFGVDIGLPVEEIPTPVSDSTAQLVDDAGGAAREDEPSVSDGDLLSVDESHESTSGVDPPLSTSRSVTPTEKSSSRPTTPAEMSVKDRARRFAVFHADMEHRHSQLVDRRHERASVEHDDRTSVSSSGTLSPTQRRWMIVAAKADYHEMCKLLQAEPDLAREVNLTNGYTALHCAARKGNVELIKLLAGRYKVDVDATSHGGYTALHIAAMFGHMDAHSLLLQVYGADSKLRDYSGLLAHQYTGNKQRIRRLTAREQFKHSQLMQRQQSARIHPVDPVCASDSDASKRSFKFKRIGTVDVKGTLSKAVFPKSARS